MDEPADPPGQPARMRSSIYDVARLAGVSHMTVSRVLNGHPNIKPSTRERVEQAIAATRYTRSAIARALATRRAMRIGVLVDGAIEHGPNRTLRAVEDAAREHGYVVSSFSLSDDEGRHLADGVAELLAQGAEALCIIAPRFSSAADLRVHSADLPTLVIQADTPPEVVTVAIDQRSGATAAVQHLIGLGHRGIAHLAGPQDWYEAAVRKDAWQSCLEAAGLPVPAPGVGDWSAAAGYAFARDHPLEGITAVFAANDQMALGVVHGLADRGLTVPGDISVVGFDDLADAAHYLPPLTTVRQDFGALGSMVVARLLAVIEGTSDRSARDVIASTLILRASTGAPPRKGVTTR